ncbi:MAG: sulfur carrier protein ThiS [Burkholderiales bacterium]|nr:sulfur carrier protein ThiS [Burkholderiales bacterium]
MVAIELNGEIRDIGAEDCIQDLIDDLSLTNQALAIAVNRQVVPRAQWRERRFSAGDKVDIVRAIGGG